MFHYSPSRLVRVPMPYLFVRVPMPSLTFNYESNCPLLSGVSMKPLLNRV